MWFRQNQQYSDSQMAKFVGSTPVNCEVAVKDTIL